MQDITSRLHLDEINNNEVLTFLRRYFGMAEAKSDQLALHNPEDGSRAIVRFSQDDAIVGVAVAMKPFRIDALEEELIRTFLGAGTKEYGRFFMFAGERVIGQWNGKGLRLVQIPSSAPQPAPHQFDGFPFVVEYSYISTGDWQVDLDRRAQKKEQLGLLLELILDNVQSPPRTTQYMWGHSLHRVIPEGGDVAYEYIQSGYGSTDVLSSSISPLPPSSDEKISVIPALEYYQRGGSEVGQPLDLPDNIEWLIANFDQLAATEKIRFLRAAFWYRHALRNFSLSRSASLTAAVQAIEVLANPTEPELCPTCGSSRADGPTASFKKFLVDYSGSQDARQKKLHQTLYNVRSDIAHGKLLLTSDIDTSFGRFSPTSARDDQHARAAIAIVRIALINWLSLHT